MDLIQVQQGIKNSFGSVEGVYYDNDMINVRDTNYLVDTASHSK